MNLYLRIVLVLLFFYATLKSYKYLSSFSEPWVQYVSYLIPLLALTLVTNRSSKIIKQYKQMKALQRFEEINTKQRWLSVLSEPDELEFLMRNQKSIDMLVYKVKTVKQAIYNKTKFRSLMKKYIETLKEKVEHLVSEQTRSLINKELQIAQKQLEVSYLIVGSEFSYSQLETLSDLPQQKYMQTILEIPISTEQKRELIANHFPFILKHLPIFLRSYFELSPELSTHYIFPLIFTPEQQYAINSSQPQQVPINQSEFYHQIIHVLFSEYRNYSLSFSLLSELIEVQEREASPREKELLFYLKLLSVQIYHNYKLDLSYESITKIEKYSLFKDTLDTLGSQQIKTIKTVFDLLDERLFPEYLIRYSFASQLNIREIIDFFNEGYIQSNQQNILSLLKLLKLKTVTECYNYQEIVDIITPFQHNKVIHQFLNLLKFCRILYTFHISTQISLVEEIWLSENQKLQQKALSIFRDMIKAFSINKMRTRYLDLDGQEFDLHVHQSIIKLSLYLKKHFFKRLLTEQTMFQMIFQHLIYFSRYGILVSLLKEEVMEKYMIDYTMIEIVVIEQIHTIFDSADTYQSIEQDIQRLIGVLTIETPERAGVIALVDIAKLIKKNRISISPSTLVKNLNVKLLYTIAEKKIAIDAAEIHKAYKLVLLYKNPQQQPNTETKQYRRFRAWLAKRYYQIDLKSDGLKILKELSEFKMAELCNTIIEIIKAHPESTSDLLYLGYDQVITAKQFQFFQEKFREGKSKDKRRDKGKENAVIDFYFKGSEFISDDTLYSNIVAQSKFINPLLKNPALSTFFLLLGNNHQQAFFNAYKNRLSLLQIEFFLKECIKGNIAEQAKVVPWMYKTLIAQITFTLLGIETSFKEFTEHLSQGMFGERGKYTQKYNKLLNHKDLNQVDKKLLTKYHAMAEIRAHVSDQFLQKYQGQKNTVKFFQDKAYRKKEITELSSRIQQEDVLTLSKLAKIQQVNLLDLIIFNICGYLNTQKIPSNMEQYLINTTLLTGKTEEGAHLLIEKFVSKIFSTRVFLSLIYGLMKLKDKFWKDYFKDKNALRILETLAAVEQSSEFYGLLPHDMFTVEIKPSFTQQTLPLKKVNILKNCLKLSNIFVVSKAMYLLHGFSSSIQKQTFQILCDKSPEAAGKLSRLLT